jgi:3-deoxy-manno-octulosonate cytidylyltransferase (CMP-KDO synthetase)
MNIIGIIPARMASSRFPGKPLEKILGMPMIGHVYHRCKMSPVMNAVYVATCDEEISDYTRSIGGKVIMTSIKHERASDRTAEAMLKIEETTGQSVDIVVMIQGDEPLVTPAMIETALAPFEDSSVNVVNLMANIDSLDEFEDPNEPKVVIDRNSDAIYFSREPIPSRKKGINDVPMYKQVCVIPFRRDYLLQFNRMSETDLERIESIDMNRIIEHGEKVRMVQIDGKVYSVDTELDLKKVENLMRNDPSVKDYITIET